MLNLGDSDKIFKGKVGKALHILEICVRKNRNLQSKIVPLANNTHGGIIPIVSIVTFSGPERKRQFCKTMLTHLNGEHHFEVRPLFVKDR